MRKPAADLSIFANTRFSLEKEALAEKEAFAHYMICKQIIAQARLCFQGESVLPPCISPRDLADKNTRCRRE